MTKLLASLSVAALLWASVTAMSIGDNGVILDKHNYYRARVNPAASDMKKMVFDSALADVAQSWADQCKWAHNPSRSTNYPGYVGENLFLTTASSLDYADVVTAWYNENVNYDLDSNSCATGKMCGHYTQVVWGESERLGCGAKRCSTVEGLPSKYKNALIVVCDYSPGGNFRGVKPYTKGAYCSRCPTGSRCDGNLCARSSLLDILTSSQWPEAEEGPGEPEVFEAVL